MPCVIEVQGYAWEKCFIPKEICLLINNETHCFHIKQENCFRSFPEKHRKIINWASKKYHGMSWESGNINLSAVKIKIQTLIAGEKFVFTKGLEKARFLREFLGCETIELTKYGCPSLRKRDYKNNCCHHETPNSHCAIDSARFLQEFLHGHPDIIGQLEKN
jgi:hypothetical protein